MLYNNLKAFRESLGMMQKDFADSLNLSKTTYNNYENGNREPRSDFWISIASKYNVSIDYLMGFSSSPKGGNITTIDEMDIVEKYRQLNDEGQEKVKDYMDDLVQSGKYKKHGEPEMAHHA